MASFKEIQPETFQMFTALIHTLSFVFRLLYRTLQGIPLATKAKQCSAHHQAM